MSRGFTVIELVTAMSLFLLVVGLGSVFSMTYLENQRVQTAGEIIGGEMRQAQADAFASVNDSAHGVKIFSDHLIHFEGGSYATRNIAEDVSVDFVKAFTLSGLNEIVFPVASLHPVTPGTVTVSQNERAIDITISSYGVITTSERTISN